MGDRRIGASLDVFRSPTEIVPTPVHAWNVRLVGLAGRATKQVPVEQWSKLKGFAKVVAIVSYDEPTGEYEQYAPYQLTVNGVRLPGGNATMP